MGTTKVDLFKYPVYQYIDGYLLRIYPDGVEHNLFHWQVHHYIEQAWIKRNKLKFKQIEHLQKLFVLPTQMHLDLHAKHSKFKQKWGYDISELLYHAD